ncbi:MAG: isochorismatase family protein [Phycisphaerae bacterium]|nr:isochorismatase family protein [Phycisphaerae bacterium]
MNARRNGRKLDCIILDLNTQRDFLEPGGLHTVLNHEALIPALRRSVAWIRRNGVPVVSSLHSLRPKEALPGGRWTYCVEGSTGQRKVPFTLLPSRLIMEYDNTLSLPMELVRTHQQVVFRTHSDDLLTHPKADRLLTQADAGEFIVLGNTIEGAVKAVTLGLLARGKSVSIVADACGYCDPGAADLAVRQMSAKGAQIIAVDQLASRRLSGRRRFRSSVVFAPGENGNGHTGGNGNGHAPSRLSRVRAMFLSRPRAASSRKRQRPGSDSRRAEADV